MASGTLPTARKYLGQTAKVGPVLSESQGLALSLDELGDDLSEGELL